ncbi:hypothetical protein ACHAXT_011591 [Thalassiosira profunda]
MAPPEGLQIGKPSKPWTIGPLLGSGACGSVHALLAPSGSQSSNSAYAVKIVPLPKSMANKTAGKKRKKTAEERNADLLLHEYTTLQNAGQENRGATVPEIPYVGLGNVPPPYGDTADGKFRFLVMERMAAPLSEAVPLLLDAHGKTGKIPLGDLAVAMLNCLEAMHAKNNLFVDVKSDNFMLAAPGSGSSSKGKGKKSNKKTCEVGARVRLIDFGLVEKYSDMSSSSHREDAHPAAPLVGTPDYASLNVMAGHTVSRRDDLEALGYVIAELILMLGGGGGGSTKRGKKKKDTNVLPWSHAASDEELKRIKAREMDRGKRHQSQLYAGLKAVGADTAMGNYFSAVLALGYAEKPDYDTLRCYLKKLVVSVSGSTSGGAKKKAGSASPKKKAAAKSPAQRRSARRKHDDEEEDSSDESVEILDENIENRKRSGKKPKVSVAKESAPRRPARGKKAKSRTIGTQTPPDADEMEVIELDSSSDEEDAEMDWEAVGSDGEAHPSTDKGILKLVVSTGPHRGVEVPFGGDHPATVLVGHDAGSRAMKDACRLALPDDDAAEGALAKVVLASKGSLHSARVTDMSSSDEAVFVKGSVLAKGKSRQAFVGDTIKLGDTLLHIRKA